MVLNGFTEIMWCDLNIVIYSSVEHKKEMNIFCLYYESQWGPKVVLDLFHCMNKSRNKESHIDLQWHDGE